MNLADRIALGTKFLDEVKPGWAGQIDTYTLDMSDPESCILGQTFEREAAMRTPRVDNGYIAGGWELHDWLVTQGYDMDNEHVEMPSQEMCGFECKVVYDDGTSLDSYEELQAEWMKVITTHV